ncbi:SRPBCC family protein [Mesorhizobium sp. BAC0120]|uniref:SRPBCC family protein n=1 Tax=Mesorhizobium sp. BAC0120 TaxID=3090670 RepID=UPI00298D1D4B|nr:SRPBCC family protein [Mesorhizobium sp. BAC0120]MDW6025548.1 SRPBCC family protein [Mesorhizobium sp. BAC0120]
MKSGRTDSVSRVIKASPQTIYKAFLDPEAWASWLPPDGMSGHIDRFDPREGGTYRMVLTYDEAEHTGGKTSVNSDVVEGRFIELVPNERVVHVVEFESDDPAFSGEMKMIWSLAAAPGGTEVTMIAENVPTGIRPEDHEMGMSSTLANLAACVE